MRLLRLRTLLSYVVVAAVAVAAALLVQAFLVKPYRIPSESMASTLKPADRVLVNRLEYHLRDPHRGDIIVFRYPEDIRQTFVKRVMGVSGDRIHLENKRVWLNGHLLDEPYVVHKTEYTDSYRDNFPNDPNTPIYPGAQAMLEHNVKNGEIVVPRGYFFAMGDNRDYSLDSRYWGFVPRENIIGKPLVIYWSYNASTEDLSNPGATVSHLIDVVIHFPTKTRWIRTFRLIHSYPVK